MFAPWSAHRARRAPLLPRPAAFLCCLRWRSTHTTPAAYRPSATFSARRAAASAASAASAAAALVVAASAAVAAFVVAASASAVILESTAASATAATSAVADVAAAAQSRLPPAAATAATMAAAVVADRKASDDDETVALIEGRNRGQPLADGTDAVPLLPPLPLLQTQREAEGSAAPLVPTSAACEMVVEMDEVTLPAGDAGGCVKASREMDWSAFARVVLVGALQALAVAMVVPVRPKLLLDALGGSASRAAAMTGGLSTLDAVVEVVSNPALGHASDLYGRRGVLLLSQAGLAADLVLTVMYAGTWQAHVAATLVSAATGAFFVTLATITADLAVGSGEEAAAYGALGAAYGVAFAVGPALGGAMAASASLTTPFRGAMATVALNAMAVWWVLPETAPAGRGWLPSCNGVGGGCDSDGSIYGRDVGCTNSRPVTAAAGGGGSFATINPLPRLRVLFRSSVLWWLGATVAASGMASGGLGSMLFFYTNTRFGWGPPETGRFLSAVGISMILSQGVLARPAVAVLGERPLIFTGYALKALHLVLYGAAQSGGAMYRALAVATLGYAAGPAWKGLLARQVEPDEQGALQGGLAALSTVVQPVAPLVATGLFGYFAPRGMPGVPLYVMAALTLGAMAIAAKALAHPQLR
ncbi:hypothetical protein MMPV_005152 [Pyropia vietnamensis]